MGTYLEKLEKIDRGIIHRSICKPKIQPIDGRPLSIADSEIQKVSDFGENGLIKDISAGSLEPFQTPKPKALPNIASGEINLSTIIKVRPNHTE